MTRRRSLRRSALVFVTTIIAALAVTVNVAAPAFASAALNGGGSGFAALEIDQWRADTARSPFNLSVNYVAQGSSFGRAQFAQQSFDYGVSDIQYPPTVETPPSFPFVYVPVSVGGMAFMYNLVDASGNQINSLKLTRRAACKIFTGAISNWDDPEIVATNPSFASFDRPIRPIIRTDGAGESYVFSEFCIAVAPDVWNAFIAQQHASPNASNDPPEFFRDQPVSIWPQSNWSSGNPVSIPFADGTANDVADPQAGSNSITYVAAGYAKVRQFPTASVQNAAGVFTQPDETNVTVALGYATKLGNGTFKLAFNGGDPRAYFPSTYSYVLAHTSVAGGFSRDKGAALASFLCYAVSEGQAIAPTLRYARLSSVLVNIAISAIVQIPGAPSAAACPVAGAPPPPPPPSISVVLIPPPGTGPTTTTVPGSPGSPGSPGGGGSVSNGGKPLTPAQAKQAAVAAKAAVQAAKAQAKAKQAALVKDQIDSQLAAVATHKSGGGRTSTIWIVVAGIGLAWAATVFASRRKKVA